MKKFYLILAICLLILLSLPKDFTVYLREKIVICLYMPWRATLEATSNREKEVELQRLKLENKLLQSQIAGSYEWLLFQKKLAEELENLKILFQEKRETNAFFERRTREVKNILQSQLQAIPAKVVFRDSLSWGSSLWINVGSQNNENLGRVIIAKNSPVVFGDKLVGVVEHVGENFSEVRLISDSSLVTSVRAVRGGSQNRSILEELNVLEAELKWRDELFESLNDKITFFQTISKLKNGVIKKREGVYLAKGELSGTSHPCWRGFGHILKGRGFNYNSDSGKSEGIINQKLNETLIKEGDLLVTTGLDGLFPAGLSVGVVSKIFPIKEGDYVYNIEASALVSLNSLQVVFVLPPSSEVI